MKFFKDFEVEVKCPSDNAWYTATVESKPKGLKINYDGFENYEEYFTKTDEIKERIRFKSVQVQDEECDEVVEGKTYCVCNKDRHTTRYFDAKVIKVHRTKHEKKKKKDVENCKCKFDIKFYNESIKHLKKKVKVNHVCKINPQNNEELISNHQEIKKFFKKISTFSHPIKNKNDENVGKQKKKKEEKNNEKKRRRVAAEGGRGGKKENGDDGCNRINRESKRKRTMSSKVNNENFFCGHYVLSCNRVVGSRRVGEKKKKREEEESRIANKKSKRSQNLKFENRMDSEDGEKENENERSKREEEIEKNEEEERREDGQNSNLNFDNLIIPEMFSEINWDEKIMNSNLENFSDDWIVNVNGEGETETEGGEWGGGVEIGGEGEGEGFNFSFHPDLISDEDLMSLPVLH